MKQLDSKPNVLVQFWDIAHNAYRTSMVRAYLKAARPKGIILVVSQNELWEGLEDVLNMKKKIHEYQDPDRKLPYLLFVSRVETTLEQEEQEAVEQFCRENNILDWFVISH